MSDLLDQIKMRRQELGLKQNHMPLRIGVSRQQYQRLEARGNPRLDTLELIANGLNSEIMLIPAEKRDAVLAVLVADETASRAGIASGRTDYQSQKRVSDDPWQGLLGDET